MSNEQDILDNAPEGATHWSEAYKEYLKVNLVRKSFLALEKDGEWAKSWVHEDFRSLSDMQAIVDLRTEKAGLEKELSNVVSGLFSENELAIRDLEQQAKGVEDFFKSHKPRISMGKSAIWEVDDVLVDEAIAALKESR